MTNFELRLVSKKRGNIMSEAYTSVELQTTVPGIGYSLKHNKAVRELTIYFCKRAVGKLDGDGVPFTQEDYRIMCNRAKCHDMDKILMSLSYPQLTADYFHRLFSGHHIESVIEPELKSKYDWMEMIFDSESAKYTKPDKPGGGAFDFMSKCREPMMCYLMPYFKLFGLDREDTGFVEEIKEHMKSKIYEKDLIDAIVEYIHTTKIYLLDAVSRIDDEGYMTLFDGAVPLRHKSTQRPGGTVHERPNRACRMASSFMGLEMIHGHIEAELFDMDEICKLSVDKAKIMNAQAMTVLDRMKKCGYQR